MPLPNTFAAASARGYGAFGFQSPSDPNFSSVSMLLPGNGTNGAQNNTFLDGSTNNFTITRNGNTTQGSFSPFPPASGSAWSAAANGGSGYFDGTGDNLTAPDNAAFTMGNGDFTIEGWIYPLLSTRQFICWQGDNAGVNTSASFSMEITAATKLRGSVYQLGTAYDATSTASVAVNAWSHVALVRNGNTTTVYLNGTADGTANVTGVSLNDSAQPVKIGDFTTAGGGLPFSGYLSGFRIVKGTAVYTSNFTPPTAPLTAITNTSLLLNFTNGAIYDAAAKNDLETVGNAQTSTTQSKWGSSSMYFDGTGDWLLGADNTALQLGTGTFTVEGWVYRNASGTYGLVGKGTGTTGWLVSLNASNQIVFTFDTSTITSVGTVAATTWTHIAVVREGTGANQTKIYISGTNDGTGTVSNNFNQTNPIYVGADRTGGSAANAYLQDLRITKGVARYTSNFTPPTAPFPVR
jgi:hypothetical protein